MAISRETLLLRAIWLKAYAAPKPLQLPCKSPGAAEQLRLRFYNSVSAIRKGLEQDPKLERAVADCTLRVDPENKSRLVIGRRRDMFAELPMLEAVLGTSMEDLKTEEEQGSSGFASQAGGPARGKARAAAGFPVHGTNCRPC